jgi:excisionase family DNA binding protein
MHGDTKTERLVLTTAEIGEMLNIGKSKTYQLCNSGKFRVIKVGSALRIVKSSFIEWLESDQEEMDA